MYPLQDNTTSRGHTALTAFNLSSGDNSTPNAADAPYLNDVMGDPTLRAIFIGLYSLIFVVGISGNSLVIFAVARNSAMQTITNLFIMNLAVSDVLMCLLAVPFTPLSGLLKSWVFGETLCHLVPMTLGVTVYVSTLTSTAIAVDRYFVIIYPFRPRMRKSVCILLIIAIWFVAVSVSLPLAVYMEVLWSNNVYTCQESWPDLSARKAFTLTCLVVQYIIPCAVITYCYTRVSLALQMRARLKIGSGRSNTVTSASRNRHQMEICRKRRTNRMLIAMIGIFVCCWLPLNIILLTLDYYSEIEKWNYFLLTFFITHVIAMSSNIYNPFLYAWMNDNFQTEFRQILPCLSSRGRVVGDGTSRGMSISGLYSAIDTRKRGGSSRSSRRKTTKFFVNEEEIKSTEEPNGCCYAVDATEMQPINAHIKTAEENGTSLNNDSYVGNKNEVNAEKTDITSNLQIQI